MNCREARRLIHESLDGTASDDARRRLRQHLDSCAACASEERLFARWQELLRAPDPSEPDELYFAEMARSISAEIRRRESPRLTWLAPSWRVSWGMAAACLLLGLGIGHLALPKTITRTKIVERQVQVPGPVREVTVPKVVVKEVRVPVPVVRTQVKTVIKRVPAVGRQLTGAELMAKAHEPGSVTIGPQVRGESVSEAIGIGAAKPWTHHGTMYAMTLTSDRPTGVTPSDMRLLASRLRADMSTVDQTLGRSALAATLAADIGGASDEEMPPEGPSVSHPKGLE